MYNALELFTEICYTDNGNTYTVSGNLVMAEETGNVYIVYVYDDASTPIGMLYGITNGSETAWNIFVGLILIFGNLLSRKGGILCREL